MGDSWLVLQIETLHIADAKRHYLATEKGAGMTDIAEFERRITAAMDRISKRVTRGVDPNQVIWDDAAVANLQDQLDEERSTNARLVEELRAARAAPKPAAPEDLSLRVADLTRQLDVQGLELQRMRKTAIQLRETLRAILEAQPKDAVDAHLINKSMLAELDALRATRATETAEIDEILAELAPLIEERATDA